MASTKKWNERRQKQTILNTNQSFEYVFWFNCGKLMLNFTCYSENMYRFQAKQAMNWAVNKKHSVTVWPVKKVEYKARSSTLETELFKVCVFLLWKFRPNFTRFSLLIRNTLYLMIKKTPLIYALIYHTADIIMYDMTEKNLTESITWIYSPVFSCPMIRTSPFYLNSDMCTFSCVCVCVSTIQQKHLFSFQEGVLEGK